LESSSDYIQLPSIRVPEWVLLSASASWSAPVEESGSSLNPAGVQRFSLPSRRQELLEPQTGTPPPQIVLVEDNRGDVGLIREALEQHDVFCDLTVINNGETALRFIDEIDAGQIPRPKLFIVDLNLPKRPGKEVLNGMRASANCHDVPVVVLTSSDNRKDKEDVAAFAVSRYVRKPSRLDEFMMLGAMFKQIVYDGR
jgi:CheY-like chemotaxis protein